MFAEIRCVCLVRVCFAVCFASVGLLCVRVCWFIVSVRVELRFCLRFDFCVGSAGFVCVRVCFGLLTLRVLLRFFRVRFYCSCCFAGVVCGYVGLLVMRLLKCCLCACNLLSRARLLCCSVCECVRMCVDVCERV